MPKKTVPKMTLPKKKRIESEAPSSLKHNPFGALAEVAAASPAPIAPPAPEASEPPAGAVARFGAKVVVRRERKGRGGKTVTHVSGVEPAHREALAAEMKRALGCGAQVEGEDVLLLGDLVERAIAWLEASGARRVINGSG